MVAAADIAYGQVLSAENLQLKTLPASLAAPGAIMSIEDAKGKIAKGEIYQGEALIDKRLADKEGGTILASLVDKNMRAVSSRVNDVIGVAGFLMPGNRVDVLASRMEERRSITRTVLQNIKVLAVDQTAEASKDKPVLVQAVTAEVSPTDSEKLFQAIQEGSIHLTLRNPDSSEPVQQAVVPTQLPPKQKLAAVKNTKAPVKQKKKTIRKKRKIYRKKKQRTERKQPIRKKAIQDMSYQLPAATEQWSIEQPVVAQPVIAQPVTKIRSAPQPVLTSTVTVIRGVTQQEVTMIRKGFSNGVQPGLSGGN